MTDNPKQVTPTKHVQFKWLLEETNNVAIESKMWSLQVEEWCLYYRVLSQHVLGCYPFSKLSLRR